MKTFHAKHAALKQQQYEVMQRHHALAAEVMSNVDAWAQATRKYPDGYETNLNGIPVTIKGAMGDVVDNRIVIAYGLFRNDEPFSSIMEDDVG